MSCIGMNCPTCGDCGPLAVMGGGRVENWILSCGMCDATFRYTDYVKEERAASEDMG